MAERGEHALHALSELAERVCGVARVVQLVHEGREVVVKVLQRQTQALRPGSLAMQKPGRQRQGMSSGAHHKRLQRDCTTCRDLRFFAWHRRNEAASCTFQQGASGLPTQPVFCRPLRLPISQSVAPGCQSTRQCSCCPCPCHLPPQLAPAARAAQPLHPLADPPALHHVQGIHSSSEWPGYSRAAEHFGLN